MRQVVALAVHVFHVPPNVLRYGNHPENWKMSVADVHECYALFQVDKDPEIPNADVPDDESEDSLAEKAAAEAAPNVSR